MWGVKTAQSLGKGEESPPFPVPSLHGARSPAQSYTVPTSSSLSSFPIPARQVCARAETWPAAVGVRGASIDSVLGFPTCRRSIAARGSVTSGTRLRFRLSAGTARGGCLGRVLPRCRLPLRPTLPCGSWAWTRLGGGAGTRRPGVRGGSARGRGGDGDRRSGPGTPPNLGAFLRWGALGPGIAWPLPCAPGRAVGECVWSGGRRLAGTQWKITGVPFCARRLQLAVRLPVPSRGPFGIGEATPGGPALVQATSKPCMRESKSLSADLSASVELSATSLSSLATPLLQVPG